MDTAAARVGVQVHVAGTARGEALTGDAYEQTQNILGTIRTRWSKPARGSRTWCTLKRGREEEAHHSREQDARPGLGSLSAHVLRGAGAGREPAALSRPV
jgi:hypothetical protein